MYTWVISFLFTFKMGCNQRMASLRFGDSFTIYISTTDFFNLSSKGDNEVVDADGDHGNVDIETKIPFL